VEPEDVVDVLRNVLGGVRDGGLVLDLQVIRPNPVVEAAGRVLCEIDGEPLLRKADAAAAAIDELIAERRLVEEAVDDHDVLSHYRNGNDLVDDFADRTRRIPDYAVPELRTIAGPCVVRELCRLRRLQMR
jgi:hypothetical protein